MNARSPLGYVQAAPYEPVPMENGRVNVVTTPLVKSILETAAVPEEPPLEITHI
jgi:hypothetical protein